MLWRDLLNVTKTLTRPERVLDLAGTDFSSVGRPGPRLL